MRFETAQILEVTGIGKETLRHWKRVLTPIQNRDGRSQRYGYPELVSLCVIAQAVQALAIPIGRFANDAPWLFDAIEAQTKPGGSPMVLYIMREGMEFGHEHELPDAETISLIRVKSVIERIKSKILDVEESPAAQLDLPFDTAKVVGLRALKPLR